jgi:hypothetical protein
MRPPEAHRADRLIDQALRQAPDAGPPEGFVTAVMSALAAAAPTPWFERGLWLLAGAGLTGAAAWAAGAQPGMAAAWQALLGLPAAPALAWAAMAMAAQALWQARSQARRRSEPEATHGAAR